MILDSLEAKIKGLLASKQELEFKIRTLTERKKELEAKLVGVDVAAIPGRMAALKVEAEKLESELQVLTDQVQKYLEAS